MNTILIIVIPTTIGISIVISIKIAIIIINGPMDKAVL